MLFLVLKREQLRSQFSLPPCKGIRRSIVPSCSHFVAPKRKKKKNQQPENEAKAYNIRMKRQRESGSSIIFCDSLNQT